MEIEIRYHDVRLRVSGDYQPEEAMSIVDVGVARGYPGVAESFDIESVIALPDKGRRGVEVYPLLSADTLEDLAKCALLERVEVW